MVGGDADTAAPDTASGAPSTNDGGTEEIDDEEEDMLREAADGPGILDRRSSREVAIELLSEELGARQL